MKQEFVQEGMRAYLKIEGDDLENVGDKMFSYQTAWNFCCNFTVHHPWI